MCFYDNHYKDGFGKKCDPTLVIHVPCSAAVCNMLFSLLMLNLSSQVLPALPSLVYGGAAALAGLFACFLPETLNVALPDTVKDVEDKW